MVTRFGDGRTDIRADGRTGGVCKSSKSNNLATTTPPKQFDGLSRNFQ